MNVYGALGMVAFAGAIGGLARGIWTSSSFVLPTTVKRNVTIGTPPNESSVLVPMWVPGVIGLMFFGGVAAIAWFTSIAPSSIMMGWHTTMSLPLTQWGTALLFGLAGSSGVDAMLNNRQWGKLPSLTQQMDPTTTQPLSNTRTPVSTLEQMGTPAT
jgi:hypothetical protein